MKPDHEELQQRLYALKENFSKLGRRLQQAGQDLEAPGTLPPENLLADLSAVRQEFTGLRDGIVALIAFSPLQSDETVSIKSLEGLLQDAAEMEKKKPAWEKSRQDALAILERVLQIVHRDAVPFPPLSECQAQARALSRGLSNLQWPDSPPELEALTEQKHPLAALALFIEKGDALDNERWALLQEELAQSFGKSLSVAAARGKLLASPAPVFVAPPINETEPITASPENNERYEPFAEASAAVPPIPSQERPEEARPPEQPTEELILAPAPEKLDEADWQESAPADLPPSSKPEPADEAQPEQTPADDAEGWRDLIWRLIGDDRLGLAYHLNAGLESLYPDLQPCLPSWLVHAAALSGYLRHETGEIARLLKEDFGQFNANYFSGESAAEWNDAVRFLLIAAALRPALLAPNTGAAALLHEIPREGFNQLFEYCQVLAKNLQALDPIALKKVRSLTAWQAELKALQNDTEKWSSQAPQKKMEFAHATFVWQQWQKPGDVVHSLLLYVKQDDGQKVRAAKKDIARWSDEDVIREAVNYTDRKVLGRWRGADITYNAFRQICRHLREAVGFVRRWIDLQELRPGQTQTFSQKHAEDMRRQTRSRHQAALQELDNFEKRHPSLSIRGGISYCRRALENLRLLFDPDASLPNDESDPRHLLHADLLKTLLPMNELWEPEVSDARDMTKQITELAAKDGFDWRQAFQARSERRDHEGTMRLLEYLEKDPAPLINPGELRQAREKHLRECQAALKRDVEETRKQIETAVTLGLLGEIKRGEYANELEGIARDLPKILRFYEKHTKLKRIREALVARRQAEVESVRRRFKEIQLAPEHPIYGRISKALDKGDVLTANEYIDIMRAGQTIPESADERDPFREFFPNRARELDYFLEKEVPSPQAVIRRLKARESIPGIDVQGVTGAQSDSAAEMLDAWYTVKKVKEVYDAEARRILTHLGFSVLQLNIDRSRLRVWVQVSAEPIRDRDRCPVPMYGSGARGKYRILCIWGRPSEEDILNAVGETLHGSPVLVFYFGRLTEKQRRDLARLCRERRRTFVVLDDTLLLYLCGERGSRLPVFFKCALPFTFLEPYITTASLVPPEMFYGRKREREAISKPMGSCFIYGGRQLGKTALQREVAQSFQLNRGEIALWVDLRSEEIGYNRPIDAIWELLARELHKLQILSKIPANTRAEKILESIQNWLDEDQQRRILLLLDEADKFLDSDGKEEFARSSRLKGLMDRTERRFKVVFAGLHNVLRTTKQSNHPLAHLGTPLCIGPLLENGEARQARALIESPLASLGYRFESPDLAILILSQTNYYPSLIQLYCDQLLRHLNEQVAKFDPKSSPPYIITSKHVEEAYRSKELRESIRQRFNLTLQLDQRYEVIAYFIAYYCQQDDHQGMERGFTWSWIRDQALTWWPEGFRDTSKEAIVALLDEMVGLGVLRVVNGECYTLRSTNLIALIGTDTEIEHELLTTREAPLAYEPATFRSAYRSANKTDHTDYVDPSQRSPLTVQQEAALRHHAHGVSVVCGCDAAGLNEVSKFAVSAFGEEFVTLLGGIADKNNFVALLEELSGSSKRTSDGINLLLVTPTCAWNEEWIEEAVQKTQKLISKTSFVRIVFMANPQLIWQLTGHFDTLAAKGITTISLKPWDDAALRQWLEDCGFYSGKPTREAINKVTGNWPILLQRFYESSKSDPYHWEPDLQTLHNSLANRETANELAREFGLDLSIPKKVVRDLAILNEATTPEGLTGVMDGVALETVQQSLKWADLLSLAIPAGNGCWRVNPVVGRVLETCGG